MTKRFFHPQWILALSVAALLALGTALYSIHGNSRQQIALARQALVQEAQAHFDNLVVIRRWNALHGGVYIKQHDNLQPNPYLKDGVIRSAAGELLIKVNPAWMTRQISELSNERGQYYYHITSLKPLNPNNFADAFETRALLDFERNPQTRYYYEFTADGNFDFIGALKTETACLSCHEQQGYKVGDVRGGIRVSLPLRLYRQQVDLIESRKWLTLAAIMALALMAAYLLYRLLRLARQRGAELEQSNELLAIKVAAGTREVTNLLLREKYLRGILRTVADVNELIITAANEPELLRHACARLATHQPYCAAAVYVLPNKSRTPGIRYSADAAGSSDVLLGEIPAQQAQQALADNRYHCVRLDSRARRIFLPLKIQDLDIGVLEVDSEHAEGFETEEIAMLTELAGDLAFAVRALRQNRTVQRLEQERVANYEETILSFVSMIEQRDTYTAGHTTRVAEYCGWIAEALDYDQAVREQLQRAAVLHDIGKIATPDSLLLKPEQLNELEYQLIQEHAVAGYEMLAKIHMYRELAVIVRHHHERYDGQGYPDALAGGQIPLLARVIAVADAFDAMTTNRIYKSRKSIAAALDELQRLRGSQFDPAVVEAAIPVLRARAVEPETSQLPHSELERIRFAYFFYDQLTGLFNERYLMILLKNEDPARTCCVHVLNVRGFSIYNRGRGWAAGDELLKHLGAALKQHLPQAALFRVKGDYFVALSRVHLELDPASLKRTADFPETALGLEHRHQDIAGSEVYNTVKGIFGFRV